MSVGDPIRVARGGWLCIWVLWTTLLGAGDREVWVQLRNGDVVTGAVVDAPAGKLSVEAYWSPAPLQLDFSSLKTLLWEDHEPADTSQGLQILFRAGGQLHGSKFSAEGERLRFTTRWGQEMDVAVDTVERMRFLTPPRMLLNEISLQSRWQQFPHLMGNPAQEIPWVFGGFHFHNSTLPMLISSPFNATDFFMIELELEQVRGDAGYQILVSGPAGSRSYYPLNLTVQQNQIRSTYYQQVKQRNQMVNTMKNFSHSLPDKPDRHHVQIFQNLLENHVSIVMNGRLIGSFPVMDSGKALRAQPLSLQFRPVGGLGGFTLRGLRASRWDGVPNPKQLEAVSKLNAHHLWKFNGEILAGQLVSITPEGAVAFLEIGGRLHQLKPDEIFEIRLSPGSRPGPSKTNAVVYAGTPGDRLPLQLTRMDAEGLTGTLPEGDTEIHIPSRALLSVAFEGEAP